MTIPRTAFTCCWPGYVIGRPVISSCSLANAIALPGERDRTRRAPRRAPRRSCRRRTCEPGSLSSSVTDTSAAAPPPTPLKMATICGIAVIFTRRAAGTAIAAPITIAMTIRMMFRSVVRDVSCTFVAQRRVGERHRYGERRGSQAPMALPRRAWRGLLSPLRAMMNPMIATRSTRSVQVPRLTVARGSRLPRGSRCLALRSLRLRGPGRTGAACR